MWPSRSLTTGTEPLGPSGGSGPAPGWFMETIMHSSKGGYILRGKEGPRWLPPLSYTRFPAAGSPALAAIAAQVAWTAILPVGPVVRRGRSFGEIAALNRNHPSLEPCDRFLRTGFGRAMRYMEGGYRFGRGGRANLFNRLAGREHPLRTALACTNGPFGGSLPGSFLTGRAHAPGRRGGILRGRPDPPSALSGVRVIAV